jgi:V8-like Glu-specific endopeptidase
MTYVVSPLNDTYPFSAVVSVTATFADGSTSGGSGVMVGPNDVLTAAHVLYDDIRGAAVSVTVSPGYQASALGDGAPFGTYEAAEWQYYDWDFNGDDLLTREESQYDVGLIGLSSNVGEQTGWFGIDPNGTSGFYNLSGYPVTYDSAFGEQMTNDYGYADENADYSVFDYLDLTSVSGNSGGPLWYQEGDSAYVVGICSTADTAANVELTFSQILTWMDNDDLLIPEVPDPDLYVPWAAENDVGSFVEADPYLPSFADLYMPPIEADPNLYIASGANSWFGQLGSMWGI